MPRSIPRKKAKGSPAASDRLLHPAIPADRPDVHRDHHRRLRHHAVCAGRPCRTAHHADPDGGVAGRAGGRAAGRGRQEDASEKIREYYGFDKPVHIRYIQWLWKVLHLDLGTSYIYQDPVWDVIKSRFPVSIFLGLTGFLLSYLFC